MSMNNEWLRKQAISFLDSKKDDVTVFEMFPQIKEALNKRGFTNDDFSRMLRTINNERKQAKEAPQEEKQPTQGNETVTAEITHREPDRQVSDTRKSNASGVTIKPSKYTGPSILDMADSNRGS